MTCSDLLRARGHSGRAPRSRVKAAGTKVKGQGGPECLRVCNKCLFRNFFFFNRNTFFFNSSAFNKWFIPLRTRDDTCNWVQGASGILPCKFAWKGGRRGVNSRVFRRRSENRGRIPVHFQPSTANTKQSSSNIPCLSFPTVTLPRSANLNSFRDFDCNFKWLL